MNSFKAPILSWLRSIDGLNTHDDAYELSMSGGVTTVQVLPGSANNIGMFTLDLSRVRQSHQSLSYALGGQAYVIKLRPTADKSAISKVLEPPQSLIPNQTSDHLHWRHMKYVLSPAFLHLTRILIVNPGMLAVTILPSVFLYIRNE